MAICSVEGCGRKAIARGLCGRHYQQVRETGRCSVDGCSRPSKVRSLCTTHYDRWYKHGDDFERGQLRAANGAGLQFLLANAAYTGDDCLIWPFARDEHGYARIGGAHGNASPHMCRLAHGDPFEGAEAAHSCGRGNEGCVNPRHLRWATHRENEADKLLHGTRLRGEDIRNSKLSPDQVMSIYRDPRSQSAIAKDFGVEQTNVSHIKSGKTWSHITGHKRKA